MSAILSKIACIKSAFISLAIGLVCYSAGTQPHLDLQEGPGIARLDKARDFCRNGKFAVCLKEAETASSQLPGSYQPGYVSAYALFRLGRNAEADQQAKTARTLAPDDKKPLLDHLIQLIEKQQKSSAPIGKFRYIGQRWVTRSPNGVTSRYTISSVVIEANGLGIERDMAPKIRRQDGSEVWGTKEVDPDYVITDGIVVYAHSVPIAHKNKRCGRFPLILKAVAKGSNPANCDVVVSDTDAKKIQAANGFTHCLDNNDVIFVIDK